MAEQRESREGLVGRRDELASLHQSFEESRRGRLSVVHLAGEPGIGKSRLLEEFAASVPADTTTLAAACFEGEGAPPLWPWIQVVRAAYDATGGTLSTGLPPFVASVLRKMVPDLAADSPLPRPAPIDPAAERFRLFEAVERLIGDSAQRTPVLILIDDLHWADVDSLLLLQFLARHHMAAPVMIVGTYRDFEMERSARAGQIVGDIERTSVASRVFLRGLGRDDCERLTRQVCAPSVSEALLRTISESSEGNPLFVQEMSRAAMDGAGTADSLTVPSSLRGVIESRFADLPTDALELLKIASVIGREFDVALLKRVLREAAPELAADLADLLDRALHLRIIERRPVPGMHRFRHALMREVLYDQLAGSTRIRLHGFTGMAIEETHAAILDRHSSDLAHHYYEAALGGWAESALKYNLRAGEHAHSLAAFSEAASRYRDALQVRELTDQASPIDRCDLLLRLGRAEFLSGSAQAAQEHLEEAAELARNLEKPRLFGEAVSAMHGVWGVAGTANSDHIHLLEEALDRLPTEDSELRVALMGRLGTELYWTPQTERCEQIGREIIAMARRMSEPQVLARALNAAHFALWRPDNVDERLDLALENVKQAEQAGDRLLGAGGLVWSVIDFLELGRAAEAGAAIDAYGLQAAQLRSPFFEWQHGVLEAMRALLHGQLEDAERLALNAYQVGSEVQGANADMFFGVQMLQLRWHQGRLAELEDVVRGFVRQFPALPAWRAALAFILCEQDKVDEVRRELEWFAIDQMTTLPRDANFLITLALLTEACAAVGDGTRARVLDDLLDPLSGHVVVAGNGASCWGAVCYYRGRLAAVMGDLQAAGQLLRTAVDVHERMGALPHLALAQCRLAEVLSTDPTANAFALVRSARELAARLGMRRALQLVDRLALDDETVPGTRTETDTGHADAPEKLFRCDGDLWSIGAAQHPLRLRTSKGLEYIARLLQYEGREILAVDLARSCDPSEPRQVGTPDPSLRSGVDLGDAGEMLDARARDEYNRRLADLREELQEAQSFNDIGRAERAQTEIEALTSELSRAVGLHGRSRKAASHAERARINVTRAIKKAIAQIGKHDPALAHHLKTSISTGRFCSYTADPAQPRRWLL